ncbi:G2/mitotic-specific cyclin-B [Arthroderma uncinatum]|uniref:G2/mitotic-specific cyclin-B n=1 Tax=Arthroderma uncinatum TaxID=74035 RepID=UPI00144AF32E|nr:G2/mitotic-specific cyclin-B [Arthroderma uncinatum]KAF3481468.1 G2/mitotic-specific cyclin-B [Arthroderma uncinatum]
MPPTRSLRQRTATNENDENATAASTRLTRAKAAALSVPESQAAGVKKALGAKNTANTSTAAVQRKRAALGDVSNVTKQENGDGKQLKKPATSRVTLTSKTSTQTGGVQKVTRTNTTRAALGVKDSNKREATTEIKRPGSGSGVMGGLQTKRHSQKPARAESVVSEEPPRKKLDSGKETIKTEEKAEAKTEEKPEEKPKEEVVESQESALDEVKEERDADAILDLDAEDLYDPMMATEYVVDIFEYLKELEPLTMPNPDYMDHQDELEWKMRGILVDWLIEVHTRFRLLPETLFLTVNIIDRFLSAEVVALNRLQLVGVTAMFIASKYEEVLSPHVANFSHVADDSFSDKEILDAERHILATLNYDLSYPNPMNFLRRISKPDNYDVRTRTLAKYLMEISLVDHRFMEYRQSHIAAASIFLARVVFDRGPWDATIAYYSGYTKEEIMPVYELLIDYLCRPPVHEAFFKKYASKRFLKASIMTRQWAKQYHAVYLKGKNGSSREQDPKPKSKTAS